MAWPLVSWCCLRGQAALTGLLMGQSGRAESLVCPLLLGLE